MDKTYPEHKEYHTGCIPCQHDCIEENDELKFKVEQLEEENKDLEMERVLTEDNFTVITDEAYERIEELEDKIREAFECVEDCPELNMSNYDIDQVAQLNNVMIEVYQMLQKALEDRDG